MDQRVNDQPAFLLHRHQYQESSLILELFTRDHGRVSVLARGARKRRDAAHFQVAHRLQLGWSGRAELKFLTAIESHPLSIPDSCQIAVFYVNELLLYLLPKHDAHEEIFDAYQTLLLQLDEANLESCLRGFELNLLQVLGCLPDLARVSLDGSRIEDELFYVVDMTDGVCPATAQEPHAIRGTQLSAIAGLHFEDPQILRAAKRLLRPIIDYNLRGRRLKSREIFRQMRTTKETLKHL